MRSVIALRSAATAIRQADRPSRSGEPPHPAEPVEEGAALKIIGARHRRRRRRVEDGAHGNELAGQQIVAAARHPQAKAQRQARGIEPVDVSGRDDDAVALGERVDLDDMALDADRAKLTLQHGRGGEPGLELRVGEADRRDQPGDGGQEQRGTTPGEEHQEPGDGDRRRSAPGGRLGRQHEVEADAAAEQRRDPQRPALALGEKSIAQAERQTTQRGEDPQSRLRPAPAADLPRLVDHG
jgi:hypothetical protein